MFSVCVCVFFCVSVQVEVLRRADHPSKESYRLSLIKKLRKLSPMLQKREQALKCGNEEENKTKNNTVANKWHLSVADREGAPYRILPTASNWGKTLAKRKPAKRSFFFTMTSHLKLRWKRTSVGKAARDICGVFGNLNQMYVAMWDNSYIHAGVGVMWRQDGHLFIPNTWLFKKNVNGERMMHNEEPG
jgi:hypothetical protein